MKPWMTLPQALLAPAATIFVRNACVLVDVLILLTQLGHLGNHRKGPHHPGVVLLSGPRHAVCEKYTIMLLQRHLTPTVATHRKCVALPAAVPTSRPHRLLLFASPAHPDMCPAQPISINTYIGRCRCCGARSQHRQDLQQACKSDDSPDHSSSN